MRFRWKMWLSASWGWGVWMTFVAVVTFLFGAWYGLHQVPLAGMAVAVGIGFAIGVITPVLTALQQLDKVPDQWEGGIRCTITGDAWSFRMPSGVFTEIPWQAMELLFEHPDGWIVRYDRNELFVFRSPLRAVGLEEVFRKHLQRIVGE